MAVIIIFLEQKIRIGKTTGSEYQSWHWSVIERDPRGRVPEIMAPHKHPRPLETMNRQQTWAYWYQEIKALPNLRLQGMAARDQSSKLQESAICFLRLKPKD